MDEPLDSVPVSELSAVLVTVSQFKVADEWVDNIPDTVEVDIGMNVSPHGEPPHSSFVVHFDARDRGSGGEHLHMHFHLLAKYSAEVEPADKDEQHKTAHSVVVDVWPNVREFANSTMVRAGLKNLPLPARPPEHEATA